eukprot:scaffold1327_cov65-Cyclotella_meneghiniana.AAC.14
MAGDGKRIELKFHHNHCNSILPLRVSCTHNQLDRTKQNLLSKAKDVDSNVSKAEVMAEGKIQDTNGSKHNCLSWKYFRSSSSRSTN